MKKRIPLSSPRIKQQEQEMNFSHFFSVIVKIYTIVAMYSWERISKICHILARLVCAPVFIFQFRIISATLE